MSDQDQPSPPVENIVSDLEAKLEALLFVAAASVGTGQLAEVLGISPEKVETGLHNLGASFIDRGLRLQWHSGRVQITSAPEYAPLVERFLGLEVTSRLSRAALETLAIIAYRQPVTRPGIDAIRGVNSDGVLKSLLSKGLVQEMGRAEGPGRPILYSTTAEFLQYFGLSSIQDLPPFVLGEDLPANDQRLLKD